MEIIKVLNNNVIVSKNEQNQEIIAMGKGIAFGKKIGDDITLDIIDKVFVLEDDTTPNQIYTLIEEIPLEYLNLAHTIVSQAQLTSLKKFNGLVYIAIADHIYNTISRYKEGIELRNPLLWDIKHFYNNEYIIGEFALNKIEETFGIRLKDDEIGFIAMHFVNAQVDDSLDNIYQMTQIMQEVTNIIKYFFNVSIEEDSGVYLRYITHLRYFANRLVNKKQQVSTEDEELSQLVKRKYKNSYECSGQIAKFIADKYQYLISNEERIYLTIHIERLIYKK